MERKKIRNFDYRTTWRDVEEMTVEEAITVLARHTNVSSGNFSPRPHMAKACEIAISALQKSTQYGKWIVTCRGKVCVCSCCETEFDNTCQCIEEWNYCPQCGSKMKYDDKKIQMEEKYEI